MEFILCMQLQLILTALLLNFLWNEWLEEKCICKRFKKALRILVLIFIEHGGLNQVILVLRVCFSLVCESDDSSGIKAGFS